MKAVLALLTNRVFVSLVGLLALAVIVWFGGPLVSIGEERYLESGTARLGVIFVLTLLWGLNNLRQNKKDEEKSDQLLGGGLLQKLKGGKGALSDDQGHEQAEVQKRFKEAASILRKTRLNKAMGGMRLHELPLYIIIGPPGAGKTTAIINSGLKFPLADSLGKGAIQGIGGTRHCDWWFTDEAILIDTAGRFTTQDSDQSVDAAGWKSFLNQLKSQRKAKPINGAIVTLSLSDLVQFNDTQRIDHARKIKQRLNELREQLGISFPVYFFFTKCDLISGFTEFFETMGREEREQAWGFTFDANAANASSGPLSTFSSEFDNLLARLNSRVLQRMQQEKDPGKRAKIFAFSQEMAAVKPAAFDFMQSLFAATRLDTPFLLRGVYFTSGTQEGTPIDRVMGSLASTFGLDRQGVPRFSGQGKSFFINKVMRNVIFPEANLGESKKSYEMQMSILHKAAYAASVLVIIGVAATWSGYFSESERQIQQVQAQVNRYLQLAKNMQPGKMMPNEVLPAINEIHQALTLLNADREKFFVRGGIDQSGKLGEATENAYTRLLHTVYKDSVALFMEQQMSSPESSEQLFNTLKTYLMLADPARMETSVVHEWFSSAWPLHVPGEPEKQTALQTHLTNLLNKEYKPILGKPTLIAATRNKLNQVPLAERVYFRLKQQNTGEKYNIRLQEVLDLASNNTFRFKQDAQSIAVVPGFFTHNGFHKVFLLENASMSKSTAEESWVLGTDETALLSEEEVSNLRKNVQSLYLADYEAFWTGLLNNIEVVPFRDIEHAVDVLTRFSDKSSPLVSLLATVEQNTALTRLPKEATGVAAIDKAVNAVQAITPSALKAKLADKEVVSTERKFTQYAKLGASTGDIPPPALETTQFVGKTRDMLKDVYAAPNLEEASLTFSTKRFNNRGNDAIGRLRKHAQSLPAPVKNWVASLAEDSWRVVLKQTNEAVNMRWRNDVYDDYERRIKGRYPFSTNGEAEVALDDFARFFGPNGTLDTFYKNNLSAFINERRNNWTQKDLEGQSLGLGASLVQNMERAAYIRETFFRNSPDFAQLELELKPRDLDAKVSRFVLNIEGASLTYRHGPTRSSAVKWPGTSSDASARFETTSGREFKLNSKGQWALFRLLDEAKVKGTGQHDAVRVQFSAREYTAEYDLRTTGVTNPFNNDKLYKFTLPRSL